MLRKSLSLFLTIPRVSRALSTTPHKFPLRKVLCTSAGLLTTTAGIGIYAHSKYPKKELPTFNKELRQLFKKNKNPFFFNEKYEATDPKFKQMLKEDLGLTTEEQKAILITFFNLGLRLWKMSDLEEKETPRDRLLALIEEGKKRCLNEEIPEKQILILMENATVRNERGNRPR